MRLRRRKRDTTSRFVEITGPDAEALVRLGHATGRTPMEVIHDLIAAAMEDQ